MPAPVKWNDLELIKSLGEGQAGVVWLARLRRPFDRLAAGSFVAVKKYKNWLLEEPGQFERIVRELEVGRRLKHPNIVRTLSILRDEAGNPALVMNYYDGETLESILESKRQNKEDLDLESAFQILGGLAAALAALHKAGAIHRDVKPANVVLSGRDPILMDLGVVESNDFPERTTTGKFLGTIRYAAPEYLFGQSYDSSIDLYSLGGITYELFFSKRFLGDKIQWAQLIAEKYLNKDHLGDLTEDYKSLHAKHSLNTAEAVKFILDTTLSEVSPRTLNLQDLSTSIKQRFWESPFYISGNRIAADLPLVNDLGMWEESVAKVSLQSIADKLNSSLSAANRNELNTHLTYWYWHLRVKGYHKLRKVYNSNLRDYLSSGYYSALTRLGAIRIGQMGGGVGIAFHQSVLVAYRYGLIQP